MEKDKGLVKSPTKFDTKSTINPRILEAKQKSISKVFFRATEISNLVFPYCKDCAERVLIDLQSQSVMFERQRYHLTNFQTNEETEDVQILKQLEAEYEALMVLSINTTEVDI